MFLRAGRKGHGVLPYKISTAALVALVLPIAFGCTAERTSAPARTATEQLLISPPQIAPLPSCRWRFKGYQGLCRSHLFPGL